MAQALRKKPAPTPRTPAEKAIEKAAKKAVEEALEDFKGTHYSCHLCGEYKTPDEFYVSTDPLSATGRTPICKECCKKIVYQIGPLGEQKAPTRLSVQRCMQYLNKPFLDSLWESSVAESENEMSGRIKNDPWTSYIKNVSMKNYNTMTYLDSDIYTSVQVTGRPPEDEEKPKDQEIMDLYEINHKQVLKAVGYDPFETLDFKYRAIAYNRLVGMLDESTAEDEMKLGACVQITHCYIQAEKMNYAINELQRDPRKLAQNISTIKAMGVSIKDTMKTALDLAKDNGISEIHNKKNSKGGNTWSGQVKQLKEKDLREGEINAFDVGTAAGMAQVAELSNAAIMKTLSFDENDYTDMIKTQRVMITNLQKQADAAQEEARIFKRENKDLKDFLREKGLINERNEVID